MGSNNDHQLGLVSALNAAESLQKLRSDTEAITRELVAKANQEEICRATLYVNFVDRDTCGVRVSMEDFHRKSTSRLLLDILQRLTAMLEDSTSKPNC